MITIDLLKNHPECIPQLGKIWHEVLGKIWMPEIGMDEIESLFYDELKEDMPLTYIALYDAIPIGFCTLQLSEKFRPDLGPWLADLVVDPAYQKKGIGKSLIETTKAKAKEMGYPKLYLFTFDSTLPDYYTSLGWTQMGMDMFKERPVTVMEVGL